MGTKHVKFPHLQLVEKNIYICGVLWVYYVCIELRPKIQIQPDLGSGAPNNNNAVFILQL